MHPLLHLLMTHPGLLGEHAQAYVELLASEVAELQQTSQGRLLWSTATVASAAVGLVLAGVALMLWAALPALSSSTLWLLLITPCLPLATALACLRKLRAPAPAAFAHFKEHIQADMQMFTEFNKQ